MLLPLSTSCLRGCLTAGLLLHLLDVESSEVKRERNKPYYVVYCAVLCYAEQVPHLDGAKATQANAAMRGTRGNALVVMAALADLKSDSQPVYIPLVSEEREREGGRGWL